MSSRLEKETGLLGWHTKDPVDRFRIVDEPHQLSRCTCMREDLITAHSYDLSCVKVEFACKFALGGKVPLNGKGRSSPAVLNCQGRASHQKDRT